MSKTQTKIKFEEGEKVLCFHGNVLYEAKVIKKLFEKKFLKLFLILMSNKCTKVDINQANDKFYFVHYNGWNKKYYFILHSILLNLNFLLREYLSF